MHSRNPLLLPALAFLGGVLLSATCGFSSGELIATLAVTGLGAALSRYRSRYLLGLLLFSGAAAEHCLRPGPDPSIDSQPGETVLIAGCVVGPPAFSEGREQFVLELAPHARARVSLYLAEGEPPPALAYGQMVELAVKVREPRNFGNPGAFDYKGYLARQRVFWTASAAPHSKPRILGGRCGHALIGWIYRLRASALTRIETLFAGDAYAVGILQALLIGESSRFERQWADGYRRTGAYHGIVVSGLHVTIIAMTLLWLLRLLSMRRQTAALAAAVLIWIYTGMCGWQAPVVRSAGGFTLFAIGGFFFRECRLLNLLAALALGFLAFDPQQYQDASFQLTFLAVLALGALASPAGEGASLRLHALRGLDDPAKDLHLAPAAAQFRIELRLLAETLSLLLRLPRRAASWLIRIPAWAALFLWHGFLVSAAVQLGLALPMVLYFHRLPLSALSANLIVTPLLTIAVPVGFTTLLTGWRWIAMLTGWLIEAARRITEWHIGWDGNWRIPDPPLLLSAAFVVSLVLLAVLRRRLLLVPALLLLGIIAWHPFPPKGISNTLELTMIDVGQGDSLLVGLPDGRWMLVDGGGIPAFGKRATSRMDIGEDVVSAYLFHRGITHVDILASTHQHDDHAAGLPALIDNFRPREVWAGATPDSASWDAMNEHARQVGARVLHPRQGDTRDFAGALLDVLSPPADYLPRNAPSNNDSLVLRLRYGKHAFLLMGDAERQMEYAMLHSLDRVDVLKVGHHGSKTSSTGVFLDATHPAFALISAGKDNLYRHPHPEVLERLERMHTQVLRSDQSGLVTVRTDGRRLTVENSRYGNGNPALD
ncbi:MAG: ComEC/Rec2 family competence protein [Gemmatimonadaceae bacterium]|nr:ComEC/Rec2 family competence protein [Gemmatimonadaceae bacterium]